MTSEDEALVARIQPFMKRRKAQSIIESSESHAAAECPR